MVVKRCVLFTYLLDSISKIKKKKKSRDILPNIFYKIAFSKQTKILKIIWISFELYV